MEKIACPVYRKCSGCQLSNMNYHEQLKWKQIKVQRALGSFAKVDNIIAAEAPYHYRNKATYAFKLNKNKSIAAGIYQSGTKTVVPVDDCMLCDISSSKIALTLCRLFKSFKILPYDNYTGKGSVRHTVIKNGRKSGEIMVIIVSATPVFPAKKSFINALVSEHPSIKTVILNVSLSDKQVIGKTHSVLYGDGEIRDTLCGCEFIISPNSFYQVNPLQTGKLYNKAIELAALQGSDTMIDAYCGAGTIGIIASKQCKSVIGVESNPEAVSAAVKNAALNGASNIGFVVADAGEFMQSLKNNGDSCSTVFMDPPRIGASYKFLNSLLSLCPEKIVYISCCLETLVRDLKILAKEKYIVQKIQPVDMFPHTNHVETVVLLQRVGN